MERIIIDLEVPAISTRYDVMVNPEMEVGILTQLLCKVVEEASNHDYVPSGDEILCSVDPQRVLKREEKLCRYGVGKGDRILML